MKKLDFIVSNETSNLRFENYQDFIKQEYKFIKKSEENALFTLTHRDFQQIRRILKDIWEEIKNLPLHYVIVFGSASDEEIKSFSAYLQKNDYNNIILVETLANLWSGGGYSLWLEYILGKKYKNVIFLEDDVEVLDKDTIFDILANIDEKTIVHTLCKNNLDEHGKYNKSRFIHCTGYPTSFFEKAWNHDPRYFWRSDDLDFIYRVDNAVVQYGYERKIIDKYHIHPNHKSSVLKMRFIYMVMRNHLYTCSKQGIIALLKYLPVVFGYIWSWVLQCLSGYFTALYATIRGIFDFIFRKKTHTYNQQIMNSSWSQKIHQPKYKRKERIKIEDLQSILANVYQTIWVYSEDAYLHLKLKNKVSNIFKHWTLDLSYYDPLYPIDLLWPQTYIVDDIDYTAKTCTLTEIKNGNGIVRYIYLIFSFIFSVIIFFILLPFIIVRWIFTSKYKF